MPGIYIKKILKTADLIHATSDIEAENLKKLQINPKIQIIGHGIDIDENYKLKIKKNKIKKLIFFSRIHYKKGLLELIDIWSNIRNNKAWVLEIYGPVSDVFYLNKIKKKIKELNLEKSVFYRGAVFSYSEKKKFLKMLMDLYSLVKVRILEYQLEKHYLTDCQY